MTTAKFRALLHAARAEAERDLELRRAELRKADVRRAEEALQMRARRKKEKVVERVRREQRAATLSAVGEALHAVERTLTRASKYISAKAPRAGALVLSVSYWSVQEGRRIPIPRSKLSVDIGVDDGAPDELKIRVGRKKVRASVGKLADTLDALILPVMAKHAAEAEVAVRVDLSDEYDRLRR